MSTAWDVDVAAVAKLKSDATLMGLLVGGIHSGGAPPGASFPRLVVGSTNEEPLARLRRDGQRNTTLLVVSASELSKYTVTQIYRELYRLLNRRPLTINGQLVYTRLALVGTTVDYDDETTSLTARLEVRVP